MSVFIEAASDPLPSAEGRARQGATVAYTKPLRRNDQSYIVTVVGEVPQATAERVANSVDLRAH
jgi:sigma-E factor negative regulatory protein RseB